MENCYKPPECNNIFYIDIYKDIKYYSIIDI